MQGHCRFCGDDIPMRHGDDGNLVRVDAQTCSPQCNVDLQNARRKLARKQAALEKLKNEIRDLEKTLAWDYATGEEPIAEASSYRFLR